MDNIKIQTAQNVDISYQVASIGDRILATLLDYLFFMAYTFLVLLIAGLTRWKLFDSWALISLAMLPLMLYDLLCESLFQGMSFGKMIMKIKVVKLDGTQAGFSSYLLRWLFRVIDVHLFGGVVALISILISDKAQRLGDLAGGTTVIKVKQQVGLQDTIFNKLQPEYKLAFPQVEKLNDNDIAIIKEVVKVCMATNNFEALAKLSAKTKETMGITTHLPDPLFLNIVLQDYNYLGIAAISQ